MNPLHTLLTGADIDYSLKKDKHNLIVGLSFQQDQALDIHEDITYALDPDDLGREEGIIDANLSRTFLGFFAQDMYEITDNISFTAGIRYDVLNSFDDQFNYRAGLTGQWENGMYAKLLYGTAYRVPSYREYATLDAPNAELTPEFLKTFEGQFGYLINKKADVNLTFYNNVYDNFIQEIVVDSIGDGSGNYTEIDDEMAFNWESRKITGLELNANIKPSTKVSINAGVSAILKATETAGALDPNVYTSQTITAEEADIVFLSKYNAYFTASYVIKDNYTVGLNGMAFSKRNVSVDYQTDSEVTNADNANGFTKFDVYASAKFMDNKCIVTARMANALGSKIYSPPYGGADGYDAEWPGRLLRLSARYNF